MAKRPLVAVSMITYNHEKYIAQAIESVLEQVAPFDFELVIGDDASTDKTFDIVSGYAARYPDLIRVLKSGPNVGSQRNFFRTYLECRGSQYIALLDGDDYWTYNHKLRDQVALLEADHSLSMCFHTAGRTVEGVGPASPWPDVVIPAVTSLDALLRYDYIATCSVLYRNAYQIVIPDWAYGLRIADWPLHVFHAMHGDIGYITDEMGVYRLHGGGIWTSQSAHTRMIWNLDFLERLSTYLDPKFAVGIREGQIGCLDAWRCDCVWNSDYGTAWKAALAAARLRPGLLVKPNFIRGCLGIAKRQAASKFSRGT